MLPPREPLWEGRDASTSPATNPAFGWEDQPSRSLPAQSTEPTRIRHRPVQHPPISAHMRYLGQRGGSFPYLRALTAYRAWRRHRQGHPCSTISALPRPRIHHPMTAIGAAHIRAIWAARISRPRVTSRLDAPTCANVPGRTSPPTGRCYAMVATPVRRLVLNQGELMGPEPVTGLQGCDQSWKGHATFGCGCYCASDGVIPSRSHVSMEPFPLMSMDPRGSQRKRSLINA